MDAPLIIPVFIPHGGCPHQCAFCNQTILTRQKTKLPAPGEIEAIIETYLGYKAHRTRVELAFFGGNFLGLADPEIVGLLERVMPYVKGRAIQGIRCSTRPDTITEQRLDLIQPYGVNLIELGVQSMDDGVLENAHRGHRAFHTYQAVALLKERQIQVGVQVMAGLPGDTESKLMAGTRQIAALGPEVARIYPVLVLQGSLLARWYQQGRYSPLTLDQSIALVKEMVLIFDQAKVRVIRMGLQASEMMEDPTQVLAGPWHPAFGHLVWSALLYDRVREQLESLLDSRPGREGQGPRIVIQVHPRSESRLRGDKNQNLKKLGVAYPNLVFSIERDQILLPGTVKVFEGRSIS